MKVKFIGKVFAILLFVCAAWNFSICLKAIALGQGKYGGNTAFYLMLLCFVGGMYIPRVVRWASKFIRT